LRLAAGAVASHEAALDFGGALAGETSFVRLDLSPSGDLVEAAANLFSFLRALDEKGATSIAVAPVPARGLGAAINDRLRRAAAPRNG
jgi:L-threonylcarbamoyladenylate synthase